MDISVLGCGRWGSCIAWYLDKMGHNVQLYGREGSANMAQILQTGGNNYLTFAPSTRFTTSLAEAMQADTIVVSIASQQLRSFFSLPEISTAKNKTYVLCMKGIEIDSGLRLSQVVGQTAHSSSHTAVWLGPGHVQEFVRGVPNCMVIDSADEETKTRLVDAFSSDLIRFYYGRDLIGSEIGAAAKNVVGIAAGMLDAFGLGSLKGALMSRGTREYARLMVALGGNELSAYGLCHLGDYEATIFSPHSQNRRFGESFILQQPYKELAEGYYTVKALMNLAKKTGVELPISEAVYNILYESYPPRAALDALFSRSLKQEF